jgi:soluble lytic murein transglycosylase-like protein
MQLSGLDIALKRINMIENQFQSLVAYSQKPDNDFQKILDKKVENDNSPKTVNRSDIDNLVSKYAEKNGLDEDFVKAVINQESGFNPNATSKCGAMGLMQLMPATAQGLGVTDAYDAEQNIDGGTKYLKGLLDRFDNNKSLALAAYNAGPNAVKKYGGIPPYSETQNYVKSVLSKYDTYKGAN